MSEFLNAHYLERLCEIYSGSEFKMKEKVSKQKIQKFDIIVAGVKKCGTSSLQLFMKYHPELKGHNFYAREGHYFDIGIVLNFSYYESPVLKPSKLLEVTLGQIGQIETIITATQVSRLI